MLDGSNRLHTFLVWAFQPLWPNCYHEVYQQFTYVAHTELA
jgi:hypothetical protein